MKIGIEVSRFNDNGRGIDRYVFNLVSSFNNLNKKDTFYLFGNKSINATEFNFGSNFKKDNYLKRYRMVHRSHLSWIGKMLFKGIDIFHFPNSDVWYSKFCRTVVTLHDIAPMHFPDKFFQCHKDYLHYEKHLTHIKQNSDCIITVSDFSKRDIVKELGISEDKICKVYNGISGRFTRFPTDSMLLPEARKRLRLPEKYILFVGGIDFRKNQTVLLKSFKLLVEEGRFKDYCLVTVGNKMNNMYENLEICGSLAKELLIKKKLISYSNISNEDLVIIYNLASLFVFPSIFEGFGFPVLEAMSCGCPVISSNRCSLPEIISDAGILFDPENQDELVMSMKNVLSSPELLEDLRQKGLARAKNFQWEKTANETLSVYRNVLKSDECLKSK